VGKQGGHNAFEVGIRMKVMTGEVVPRGQHTDELRGERGAKEKGVLGRSESFLHFIACLIHGR
jgi:hypothetical protein